MSAETTFLDDISDRAELEAILLGLCEKVARRLKGADLAAGGVTLKLRLPDFKLRTRARAPAPDAAQPRACSRPPARCWRRSRAANAIG